MSQLSSGERIRLVDKKGRQYALTLKAGEIYQFSGQKIAHDAIIGRPDGTIVVLSGGKKMLALRPTFGDYVLKMPRGAQVLYPKDLDCGSRTSRSSHPLTGIARTAIAPTSWNCWRP